MAKVNVTLNADKPADEAYQRIKKVLETDSDLKKLDSSYKTEFNDSNRTGTAKGKTFTASLEVKENGSNSTVILSVKLSLLASPFKGVVESTLNKKLERALS